MIPKTSKTSEKCVCFGRTPGVNGLIHYKSFQFESLYGGPMIHIINSVAKTKLVCYATGHRRSAAVSLET